MDDTLGHYMVLALLVIVRITATAGFFVIVAFLFLIIEHAGMLVLFILFIGKQMAFGDIAAHTVHFGVGCFVVLVLFFRFLGRGGGVNCAVGSWLMAA